MIRVRFAPTPAGLLFISGARVALANYLFASRNGGKVLLRFDDLDTERCKPVYADQMMQDLRWLGFEWTECIRQSERLDLYQEAIVRLKQQGRIYPCFESEEELRAKQEFRRKRKQSLIYDRAMLALTPDQRAAAEAGGKSPHWRLRLSGRTLQWHDLVQGDRQSTLRAVSDPILVRADGAPTPILAGVVDDIATGTTHVIRGEDSAGNTAVQIELFETLTGKPPLVRFGHLPALSESGRTAPGRRVAQMSLRGLRNDGVEPRAIAACLAGFSSGDAEPPSLTALAEQFDLTALAASHFDVEHILAINRRLLRETEFSAVADRLPGGATEAFWLAVRGSLDLLTEARGWWDVVAGTIVPPVVEGEHDLFGTAEALLPPEPWDGSVWARWITAIEQATGRDANVVLPPLRLALTGEDSGPDLADLLPLIGRSRTAARLRIATT